MAKFIVGIDLGGTNIVSGCVAADGSGLLGEHSIPTGSEEGPNAVVLRMIESARISMAATLKQVPDAEFIGVGVGAPGPLDAETGVVLVAPNLGWVNMPLKARLQEGLGLPTSLDNDANCAVLGEWWRGAASGSRIALGVTLGTGIGGGIIVNGRLFRGTSGYAGEIGHMTIDANGRRCKCGNYGCVEAYASGPNIALRAVEALESGAPSTLPSYVGGDLRKITAQTVYQAAQAGDSLALEVVKETAHFLGAAIASLMNILNPEVVVVMGGVTQAGDALLEPLRREVSRRAFKPVVAACRIVPGTLTGVAGVYGAARAWIEQQEMTG